MNEEFVTQFYSSACNVLRAEDEKGKYRNNVCFSMVDDLGHYMICLKEGDHDGALFYRCFHRVLMEDFGLPVGDEDEVLGECFSLQNLQNDIETMRSLNPTEVALRENDDEIPSCVKRVAAIAEYEDAAVTEDFLPVGCACAELVFDWKKAIADRFFGGLLMADAALVAVFFKLAKEYAHRV